MLDPIQTPEEGTESVEEPTEITPPTDETPDPQETVTAPQTTPAPQEPDYKEKFAASTRENQILQDKLKQAESRRDINNLPTDAELRAAFPSYDFMTDTEKELARGQLQTRRVAEQASLAEKRREEQERFDRELEIAITSNPSLEGKERAFKEFANKPTHRGATMDVLMDAFLHRSGTVVQPRRDPQPGLETGTGGPREPAKPKTLSTDELKSLRETNYPAYQEYVRTHDIEID